jgi:hypothetical protein
MTSKFMISPRLGLGRTAPVDAAAVRRDAFRRNRRYGIGYRNAGQPTPSIGLGVYGAAALDSRARGGAAFLAAGFAGAGFAGADFLTDFATGFFVLFLVVLFFLAGFAMARNLPQPPTAVKPGCR